MKPIFLFALISIILTFGCSDNKHDDNVLPETNPLLGLWKYKAVYDTSTITKMLEFTDSILIFTREASSGNVRVKTGNYDVEADGAIVYHHISEATDNGILKPQWNGSFYYMVNFFGTDTLRFMEFGSKYTRLSGNPNELNNSSFHSYYMSVYGTDTSYRHNKAVFENDSVKGSIAWTESSALPDTWSLNVSYPVLIYPEFYVISEPYPTETAYLLSGQNMYVGAWRPESKYVKQH